MIELPFPALRFASCGYTLLLRRLGGDGEGVDAGRQVIGERGVDHAVALDSALAAEGVRHQFHREVGLPLRAGAGMAGFGRVMRCHAMTASERSPSASVVLRTRSGESGRN